MPSSRDTEFRRFLLGPESDAESDAGSDTGSDTGSEAESEAFVLRILASAADESGDAFLDALADEDDLIDEYVRGELDEDSSRRFERLVLCHEDGRRRVAFARALARRAREEAERDVAAMTPTLASGEHRRSSEDDDEEESLLSRFLAGLRAPAARPAWALCLLFLAVAVAQTYRIAQLSESTPQNALSADQDPASPPEPPVAQDTEPSQTARRGTDTAETEVEGLRSRLADSADEIQALKDELDAARTLAPTLARSADRSADRSPGPKVVSMLLAAAVRGSADQIPTLEVPTGADAVELQVDLSGGPAVEIARVRLLDATRFPVWGNPRVEPEGDPGTQGLRVRVPVGVLVAEGDHILVIEAADAEGPWSERGRYEFRVVLP